MIDTNLYSISSKLTEILYSFCETHWIVPVASLILTAGVSHLVRAVLSTLLPPHQFVFQSESIVFIPKLVSCFAFINLK